MFLKTVFSCVFIFMVSVSLFFVSLSCDDNGNNPSSVNDQDTTDQDTTDQDTTDQDTTDQDTTDQDTTDQDTTDQDTTDQDTTDQDTTDQDTTDQDTTESEWVGTFKITLRKNMDEQGNVTDSSASIVGGAADGISLSNQSWTTVMTEGDCRLVVPHGYYCEEGACGFGYVCVADSTCEAEPNPIQIGEVTVSGVKTTENTTNFSLGDHTPYMPIEEIVFPPFEDGGQVTLSVAGNSEIKIDPFTITGKGIAPLVLKNGSIKYEDGKEITLEWETSPQKHAFIVFEIDISYHGGTKAKILGETEDDGSYTIPAKMLDKLKTYGITGFPRLIVYRRATFKNKTGNVDLVIESEEMRYLDIPGIISCNGWCPDGMTCGDDRICHEVE